MSARSRAGLAALAKRLPGNMSAEQLAHGIIEIANWNQANAIRQMTIQRGIDPRGFALLAVRRRRAGAIAGGHGAARHEGLHRAAQSRQPVGLRTARGRLAHRPYRHQGDAPGRDRSRDDRRALRRAGAGRGRYARARRHRSRAHPPRARSRHPLRRPVDGSARAGAGAEKSTRHSSPASSMRSMPLTCAPSATTMPASRRSSW